MVDGTAAVIGRCFSIDGRFSLSLVVAGRVLDDTILDANVAGVFDASVTPLFVVVGTPGGTSGA